MDQPKSCDDLSSHRSKLRQGQAPGQIWLGYVKWLERIYKQNDCRRYTRMGANSFISAQGRSPAARPVCMVDGTPLFLSFFHCFHCFSQSSEQHSSDTTLYFVMVVTYSQSSANLSSPAQAHSLRSSVFSYEPYTWPHDGFLQTTISMVLWHILKF